MTKTVFLLVDAKIEPVPRFKIKNLKKFFITGTGTRKYF